MEVCLSCDPTTNCTTPSQVCLPPLNMIVYPSTPAAAASQNIKLQCHHTSYYHQKLEPLVGPQ